MMSKTYLITLSMLIVALTSCKSTEKTSATSEPSSKPEQVEGAAPSRQDALDAGIVSDSDEQAEIERAGGVPELSGEQVVSGAVRWLYDRLGFSADVSEKSNAILMEAFINGGGKPEEMYPKPMANQIGKTIIRNSADQIMELLDPAQQAELKQLLLNQ
jgi:hypothetical protein